MKRLVYILPLFALFSCGGSGNSVVQETQEDTIYAEDHEWIISAKKLKEKLGILQASFVEIGNKEVVDIICGDDAIIPYNGNKDEMNIWLLTTYMLDNFSTTAFGKNNFEMPDVLIKNETPLSELNWLNFNGSDSIMFNIYRNYPDLTDIPKEIKNQNGMTFSNEETVQKADMVYKALEDGLFGVVTVTDYLPPVYVSETSYESGYVMGYVLFADWETGKLSCILPFLAQNSSQIDFNYGTEQSDKYSKEVLSMQADLQHQTYATIDSIARVRTGFEGPVWVNYSVNMERYKD